METASQDGSAGTEGYSQDWTKETLGWTTRHWVDEDTKIVYKILPGGYGDPEDKWGQQLLLCKLPPAGEISEMHLARKKHLIGMTVREVLTESARCELRRLVWDLHIAGDRSEELAADGASGDEALHPQGLSLLQEVCSEVVTNMDLAPLRRPCLKESIIVTTSWGEDCSSAWSLLL